MLPALTSFKTNIPQETQNNLADPIDALEDVDFLHLFAGADSVGKALRELQQKWA